MTEPNMNNQPFERPRIICQAPTILTLSTHGQDNQIDPCPISAPRPAIIVNPDPRGVFDVAYPSVDSPSPEPTINCTIANIRPKFTGVEIIDQAQDEHFIDFLRDLVALLKEKSLIGAPLPASIVTSLIRSHRSRLSNRKFRAIDLAERIDAYDNLVVDGVEITARFQENDDTGRTTSVIRFHRLANCNESTNCVISPHALRRTEQRIKEREERRWKKMPKGQRKLRDPARINEECRVEDIYVEDAALIEHIQKLMAENKKPKPIITDTAAIYMN